MSFETIQEGDWGWRKLGDIAHLNYGKGLRSDQRISGRIPVYSSAGLTGYHNQPLVNEPGIIVGRKGTVGTVHISEEPFYCIDTAYYIRKSEVQCDFKFLYYLLKTLGLEKMNQDSAVPGLNRNHAHSLSVSIPNDIAEQKRIASILSAFDAKIELNRQTNTTLEAIAQAIFKEWFVDFNYPGATGEMVDSPLGLIPKSWDFGKLGQIITQQIERVRDEDVTVLSAVASGDLIPSDDFFSKRVYSKDIKKYLLVRKWDFAYNPSRINIGSIGLHKNDNSGAVSPVYVIFRPKTDFHWYIEFFLRLETTKTWINTLASGSVRQSLPFKELISIPLVLPPVELIHRFNKSWNSLHYVISKYSEETATLKLIRDTLLTKFMNREIGV